MARVTGMGGHQSAAMMKDEWLTPPRILHALGAFDLDPCAPINRPWDTAGQHFTVLENGMAKEWFGRVWLNPPYGLEAAKWLRRLAAHGTGTALIFARTETSMFFECVWNAASAVFFFEGRLHFYHGNGKRAEANAGAPSCLVAYGKRDRDAIARSGLRGKLIVL